MQWQQVPYTAMDKTTATKLHLITTHAKENPKLRFTSLQHHINPDHLLACFNDLKRNKAAGIDGKTTEHYSEQEIRQTLTDTVADMKAKKYKPQPVRRVFIPKENNKTRPLGIPTVIDKTVQLAAKHILEAIYEQDFLELSYGYRPNKDAHQALKALNHMVMQKKVNYILDADIKGFFDRIDHHWMMRMLSERISDPRFKTLIHKFLKSGIMQEGKYSPTIEGSPQGGIVSPVLANIYLHYVLDLWFEKKAKKELTGYAQLIRYADDFVIGFQHKRETEEFLKTLEKRLSKFSLSLANDKTRVIEFGRFARENKAKREEGKPATFDFLGMTHYCSTTRDGRFSHAMKTSKKRLVRSTKAMNQWLKRARNVMPIKDIWARLGTKLTGHYQYYGVSGNFESINQFYKRTLYLTYKWMNRRSQKQSFYWKQFYIYLEQHPLPKPKLAYQVYNMW